MLVALIGVFGLFGYHPAAPGPRAHETIRVARWTVRVDRDRFTGATRCSVRRGRAQYEPGVLVLKLSPYEDTSAADFRVDWGASYSVRSQLSPPPPAYAPLRVALTNPSLGEVRVPQALVSAAREVEVRPAPHASIVRVRVDGLAAALERARAAGC